MMKGRMVPLLLLVCYLSSVFAVSITTDSWIQMATPLFPPNPMDSHTAVVNFINNTMVIFGGKNGDSVSLNNISIYYLETDTWGAAKPTGPIPQARYGHTAVVSAQNMMVVFAGMNETGSYFNDIAVYDLEENMWVSNIVVSGTPPSTRIGHTAVVDTTRNQMVVFGGRGLNENYKGDIYFFDLNTYTWLPTPSNGTDITYSPPSPRAFHSAIVSPLNVMVIFGGTSDETVYGDTSCFSLFTYTWFWCNRGNGPESRNGHTAVISPVHKMTIFGGHDGSGYVYGDIWNLDLFTYNWVLPDPSGLAMSARYYHTAVSTPFGTMVLYGGISVDGAETNDLGKYNLVNTVLRNANDGAVLVVLITLIGTLLISMCFAMDYMQEQNAIEKAELKEELKAKSKASQFTNLLPKIPMGPKTQKFFEDFKLSLDPLKDPPQ